jgi:MFS family permease
VVHGETSGGPTRLWFLYVAAVLLLVAFARWEVRTVRRGRQPLLDPRLARTSGYAAGSGIGLVYFSGFTGIWLVFALFFQDGLGYSPLRSGLAVTPFALGVAVSAVIAGRLVGRIGRWLTVCGLIAMSIGLFAAALVLRNVGGDAAAWTVAGPMLVAGLGGGLVTSPNITLTLESVPVQMAGAAGGALQTAQRIGGAIGTAVLATIFYQVLIGSGRDYAAAVSDALLVASGIMVLALVMAIAELIRRRPHRRNQPPPLPRPEHHLHHI